MRTEDLFMNGSSLLLSGGTNTWRPGIVLLERCGWHIIQSVIFGLVCLYSGNVHEQFPSDAWTYDVRTVSDWNELCGLQVMTTYERLERDNDFYIVPLDVRLHDGYIPFGCIAKHALTISSFAASVAPFQAKLHKRVISRARYHPRNFPDEPLIAISLAVTRYMADTQ